MSELLNYYSLSQDELNAAVRHEAVTFRLPPGWDDGRESVERFAFDDVTAYEIDDAVSADETPDGSGTLHVSISDIGSYAHLLPATMVYAQRKKHSRYSKEGYPRLMLPYELSQAYFSLINGRQRPAMTFHIPYDSNGNPAILTAANITREVVTATALTRDEVELARGLNEAEFPTPIHVLARAAGKLSLSRHGILRSSVGLVAGGERNIPIGNLSTSGLIVTESMLLANMVAGRFFAENDVTAIYRRHDVPEHFSEWFDTAQMGPNQFMQYARTSFGITPGRHLSHRPDGEIFPTAPVTSPLRKFIDFVNQCNLAAHLDGRELPFAQNWADLIATTFNAHEDSIAEKSRSKRRLTIDDFSEKFNGDSVLPEEYAQLFFGVVVGTAREIAAARARAVELLLPDRYKALHILKHVIGRGYVRFDQFDGNNRIIPADGKPILDKHLKDRGASNIEVALDILAQRAGLDFELAKLRDLHRSGQIERVKLQIPARLREAGPPLAEQQERVRASLARANELRALIAKNPKRHPVTILEDYIRRNKLKVEYLIESPKTKPFEEPESFCEATISRPSKDSSKREIIHTITESCQSGRDAKLLAAEAMVDLLGLEKPTVE